MGARIISLLAVLVLVTACTSTAKDTDSVTTDGSLGMSERAPITDMEATMQEPTGPAAGTQQDFVINVGDRVFFGYDQYDLTSEARSQIEQQVRWLKQYPNLNVTVEGHCDERGTREYNLALGEKRAMAVRNFMIALGISPSRIQTISYGKERPAVLGSDESSWAQNRRAVTVVE